MKIAIIIFTAAGLLYILSVRGRAGHPGLEKLRGWSYAHRGLHGNGVPENSMTAFRKALEGGYGVEFDVHLLADGGLAVIHDSKLIRTTGAEGRVEDLTTRQLQLYHLENTAETIPEFTQVLELFAGKAPLIIELKVENNANALCEKVAAVLDHYEGVYCIESFHPQAVAWFKEHRPDVIRGQLTENYFRSENEALPGILKFILGNQISNVWARPDFVAYNYRDLKTVSNFIARKIWKLQGIAWTIKDQQQYDDAVKHGWIPIFEGFEP